MRLQFSCKSVAAASKLLCIEHSKADYDDHTSQVFGTFKFVVHYHYSPWLYALSSALSDLHCQFDVAFICLDGYTLCCSYHELNV